MLAIYSLSRAFVGFLVVAILASPLPALAQATDKSLRIGILSSGVLENRSPLDAALVDGLREQGYVEGRNLFIERRYSTSKLRDNASELAGMKLDAVLTTCTPSTRLMKQASSSTPIVMVGVSDPVNQGVIVSLARPGENVTGLSSQAEDLLAKRLEMIASILPKSTVIAVLANVHNPVHDLGWQRLESTARAMNLRLVRVDIGSTSEVQQAMDAALQANAGALLVLPDDPLTFNARPQLVAQAAKYHLPDFYWAREFVESGGLMSYGESLRGSYRSAASYIDKIKRGAHPGDLPVEQPTRFELVINLKTAKDLGLTIPQSVLVRADDLIQ
jgi:putative ABC transport system substrate-binding protein